MSILSVDNISPIGSGTSVTINNAATLVLNNVSVAGVTTITGTGTNGLLKVERASGAGLHIQAQSALGVFGTTSNHNLRLISNGNERILLSTNGNVGINENLPGQRLTVGGDIQIGFNTPNDAGRQLNFNVNRGSAGQTLANINWQWNSKFVAQIRGIAGADTTNKDDGHLAFFTSAANSLVERLRITSNGNVGIGIVDPDQQLEVSGIIKVGSYFQGGASGTATNNWHFGAEGNGEFRFYTGNYGAGNLKQTINNNGDVLPGVHNTSDLGSSSKRWRNVYTTDLQLSNEGKTNDVDGTWGNYTIQEGESELFLINNRNGKKYVFLLKEVL